VRAHRLARIFHPCHMCGVSLRAAILGFLDLEPTSGYALRQRFEGSVGSFWSVTQSQIYRELHALEADGLATATREPGDGRPDRKRYTLTPAGRSALAAWLREPLEPVQLRHPLLLKLVFASNVPPAELDHVLERYAEGTRRTRDDYRARASSPLIFSLARSPREAEIWRLSIEHGLAWCETELDWIERARERLATPAARKRTSKSPRKPRSR
jgi:PadR family transcriptional regulator, regulatory protein AphA